MQYFNLLWVIGCGVLVVLNIWFWNIAYALCVKMGMRDCEGNGFPFGISLIVTTILYIIIGLAPFNHFYQ